MTRTQRQLHARVFYVLTPLLLAALAFALLQRQRAQDHLAPTSNPVLESVR
ncbi:MAG TPA: hypothetical protein VJR89_32945 [Polyangiales bacterium]|nr:hypothetical protein [Polyangiales bacterium]